MTRIERKTNTENKSNSENEIGKRHMTDDLEIRKKRALYRACHRGTKEMDCILGQYAEDALGGFSEQDLQDFERLLDRSDHDLLNWFTGKEAFPDNFERTQFERLQAWHEKNPPKL